MEPTIHDFRIMSSVLPEIAIAVTLFRLYIRYSRSKLWWDDFWVSVSMLCVVVLVVANFLHTADPTDYPQKIKIIVYYLSIQLYYAVSWTSRLSILFTVVRLSWERLRFLLTLAAVSFLLMWVILFAQVFWVCEPQKQWKETPIPQCILGSDVAIAQMITMITSDIILVVAPIWLLWNLNLPKLTKIRLMAVFASTISTTAVSLYYIYEMLRVGGIGEAFSGTVHDSVRLMVANLTVVVAFICKLVATTSEDSENIEPLHHSFFHWKKDETPTIPLAAISTNVDHTCVHVHVERIHDLRPSPTIGDSRYGTKNYLGQTTWIGEDSYKSPEAIDFRISPTGVANVEPRIILLTGNTPMSNIYPYLNEPS